MACLAVALLPATAAAAVRYASPTGVSSGQCPQVTPCEIEFAVETVAQPNDEVILAPGTYALGGEILILADAGLNVHGEAGQPLPLITATGPVSAVTLNAAARVGDIRIEASGPNGALVLNTPDALAERVYVEGEGGFRACALTVDTLIRDSVCHTDETAGQVALQLSGPGAGLAYALNVTAVASFFSGTGGHAVEVSANGPAQLNLLPRNLIALGTDADFFAETTAVSGTARIIASNSNYDSIGGSGPGIEAISAVGSDTNQSSEPLLANVATGDFHQLEGSPTINAGGGSSELGALDVDREPRVQGGAPDIGADEFPQAAPPPGVAPSNEFRFGKVKRNKRKGKAKLTVAVPGPGELYLARSHKVRSKRKRALAAGSVRLAVKPTSRAKRKLADRGKLRLRAAVTYTPDGGEPRTKSRRVKLIRR